MYANRWNLHDLKEIGVEKLMVTSDFRPEVEIWPFRTFAMKNTPYNSYLWPNRQNFPVFKEIGVKERDGDVRFWTGSGNTAVSRMRNKKYAM